MGVEDRAVQGEAVAGVGGLGVVEQDQVQPVTPELLVVVRVGGVRTRAMRGCAWPVAQLGAVSLHCAPEAAA
ncbi:hypothetical protein C1N79_00490 [Streptomyces sp. SGAir0924]|nr:hypothetical protein C1N79_00490 [Streptomyces sp. SGAir0924]